MTVNNKIGFQFGGVVKFKVLTLITLLLIGFVFNAKALETNIEVHKALDAGTYGYSFGITDNFFKQKAFNWKVSYNQLDDVNAKWNNTDWDMSLDTIDAMLTYRYFPKSYNKIISQLTFEVQAGAAISLTESRLIFPVEDALDDIILSEKGDVNAVVSFLVYYKMSKSTSMHIGIKHYPSYSEYGDVSSIFLGFDYHFSSRIGY